ncbi:MAG: DUF2934 domain-containing protein [Alphaproteobacteria bacterium]|nr:DUF2934 domain-containing protein [Alphaproteobacteria bacterium]
MSKCSEKSIQEAAYYLWQNNGCPAGSDEYFWSKAVEQLSNCNCTKSSKASTSSAAKKTSTTTKKASASTSKTITKKATTSSKK